MKQVGRPRMPRLRLTDDFADHLFAWSRQPGVRGLCRAAFDGDDSPSMYNVVQRFVGRGAFPDTPVSRERVLALARATKFRGETTERL